MSDRTMEEKEDSKEFRMENAAKALAMFIAKPNAENLKALNDRAINYQTAWIDYEAIEDGDGT